jgi:hypothetical protein
MLKRWRNIGGPILAVAAAPLLVDCGAVPGVPGAGGCQVDLSNPQAIMQANFGLSADVEGKLKGALAASANLQKLAVQIEGDVAAACGQLAKDLGASDDDIAPKEEGPGKKAEAACQAAVKVMGELKAKASGSLTVDVTPPKCSASMEAMADCAASCDASIKPGEAKVECEGGEISGSCEGECSGTCTVEAGVECEGTCSGECSGSCEANFSGKCDGTCKGKCDGKDKEGKCAGNCEGSCEGSGKGKCGGTCKGTCSASCEMQGKADCKGSCSGGCSVEMKAPKCSGEVKPPEMSAECQANCDAELNANVECTPAGVVVKLEGAADADAAGKLQAALEANLPALLKVTLGMKGRLEGVMANVQASVEGIGAVVKGAGTAGLKVMGCVTAAVQAQAQASASINVSVSASASASGEAGAG